MYGHNLKELVGLKIVNAYFSDGAIFLATNNDEIYGLYPQGDCCAHCYINGIDSSELLIGTVTEVEDLTVDVTEEMRAAADETIEAWGHRIHTDKGICTIDMRVEHNGYYGGWLQVKKNVSLPIGATKLEDIL